jgi:hypothetical protein
VNWALFEQLDHARRLQGSMLDVAGLGPVETPYSVAHSEPGLTLRRYADGEESSPTVLIVPAPIKRPYIWDLAPKSARYAAASPPGRGCSSPTGSPRRRISASAITPSG